MSEDEDEVNVPARRGRIGHIPTDESRRQVLEMAALGMTQEQIGLVMDLADRTLRRRYRRELDIGGVEMLMKVSRNLHEIAMDRDDPRSAAAAMFVMKTRAGWRETNRTEVTGPGGGPLQLAAAPTTVDPRLLSLEERESLRAIAQKAVEALDDAAEEEDED